MTEQERQEMIDSIENAISLLHTRIFKASQKGIKVNLEIVTMITINNKEVPFIWSKIGPEEKSANISIAQAIMEKYPEVSEMITKSAALASSIDRTDKTVSYWFGDGSKIQVPLNTSEIMNDVFKGEM